MISRSTTVKTIFKNCKKIYTKKTILYRHYIMLKIIQVRWEKGKREKNNKVIDLNPNITKIILTINSLNMPIKTLGLTYTHYDV